MAPVERVQEIALDPLPKRVARLLAEERAQPLTPPGWAAIQARMAAQLQGRGGSPTRRVLAHSGRRRRLRPRVLLASAVGFVLGCVAGAFGEQALQRGAAVSRAAVVAGSAAPPLPQPDPRSVATLPIPSPPSRTPPAPTVVSAPGRPPAATGRPRALAAHPRTPPPPSAPPAPLGSLEPSASAAEASPAPALPAALYAEEQALIESAKNELRQSNFAAAYARVQAHQERFPEGQLAEERELIAVWALLGEGERRRAVERILAFHRRHPQSLLLPAIDALAPTISGQ